MQNDIKLEIVRYFDALRKQQREATEATEKAQQQAGHPVATPKPTLAGLGPQIEEIASYWLALTTEHGIPKNEDIDGKIAKLRRLNKTGDDDFAQDAIILLDQVAGAIAKTVYMQVLQLDLMYAIGSAPLANITLNDVILACSNAQKKAKLINEEIDLRLVKGIVTEGVSDKVLYLKKYLVILNKFLQQPNTNNQIVLRSLHAIAQSIAIVLRDIYKSL